MTALRRFPVQLVSFSLFVLLAVPALGQDRDAVPALRKKLHDPHHRVRAAAATSLGLMGVDGSPAVTRLIELTGDKSHHVRRASAVALGRIGSEQRSTNQELLNALQRSEMDHRHSVRQASSVALESLK